jgi:hypothetical protein
MKFTPPNKACTPTPAKYAGAGVVGVAAFSGSLRLETGSGKVTPSRLAHQYPEGAYHEPLAG